MSNNLFIQTVACVVGAYLLGSICSAIFFCRLLQKPDPRTVGSRNPGATNVLRCAGRLAAILTLMGDILKGFIPVVIAKNFGLAPLYIAIVGFAALLGHLFPIYFKFKGGKGVATTFGVIYGLNISLGLLATLTWLLLALTFRYSSLAAIIMVIALPGYCYLLDLPFYILPTSLLTLIVIITHQQNIRRLIAGKESKLGHKY